MSITFDESKSTHSFLKTGGEGKEYTALRFDDWFTFSKSWCQARFYNVVGDKVDYRPHQIGLSYMGDARSFPSKNMSSEAIVYVKTDELTDAP